MLNALGDVVRALRCRELAATRQDKMSIWQQSREDKQLLMRQVEELQNVMSVLKKEKEEEYRISRRDREVLVS